MDSVGRIWRRNGRRNWIPKIRVVSCVVISLGLWASGYAQSQPPAPSAGLPNQSQQSKAAPEKQKADNNNTPPKAPFASLNQSVTQPSGEDHHESTYEWIKKTTYRWGNVSSGIVVAFFTAILTWVSILQWRLYRRQTSLMEGGLEETRKAADAAKESADATKESVAVMERNAQRELRAYVGIIHPKCFLKDAVFMVQIKNCGQTPAYKLFSRVNWKCFNKPNVDWPKSEPYTDYQITDASVMTVLPDQEFTSECPVTESAKPSGVSFQECMNRYHEGKATIYFYGTVSYEDAFQAPRNANYCFRLEGGTEHRLAVCSHHNDSD